MDERVQTFRQWLEEVGQLEGLTTNDFARLILDANDPAFPEAPMTFELVRAYLRERGEYDRKTAQEGVAAWNSWLQAIRCAHRLLPAALAAYHRLAQLGDPSDEALLDELRLALHVRRVDVDEANPDLPPLGG